MVYDYKEYSSKYQINWRRKMASLFNFFSLHKVQTFFIIFTGFGMMYLISSISELKRIQGPVQKDAKFNSRKPVYWLSAKNSDSGYMKHVQEAFKGIGYERWDEKTGGWDVMWSYEYPFGKITAPMLKPHQLVNHFPGSGYLTSKGYLALSTSRYIPLAFSLPKDVDKFKEFVKKNPDKLWVQKNNNHRGIRIKSMNELDFNAPDSFIQEFVRKPYLVDGHKFDVGIYTVITSVDPLLVYVLDTEWLIRYCPDEYEPFDATNPRKYVVEDDYTPTWKMPSISDGYSRVKLSHKQSLLQHVKKSGHDPKKLQEDLYSAVAELVRDKQENIMKSVSNYPYGSRNFFELVRFDFVFDEDMNVYAMEVNMSPNLSSGHFADNARMYRQVMYNTLSLVGVATDTKPRNEHEPYESDMGVSDRDIVSYPEECSTCKSCSGTCMLCQECLTESWRFELKSVYLQQVSRRNFVRVHPKRLNNPTEAEKYHPLEDDKLLTKTDKMVALWLRGKCLNDPWWCL